MHVKRDPFARGEYTRFCHTNQDPIGFYAPLSCKWCGQTPKRVYSYVWQNDDSNRPVQDNGQYFCNLGCFQSYN